MAKSKSVRPAKRTLNHLALLNLETARADDATRQFNEAQAAIKRMESEVEAANANMAEMGKRWKDVETHSREEIVRLKAKCRMLYDEEFFQRTCNAKLQDDLAHSDADRRQLQRDIEAQKKVLDRWGKFDCVSPALRASHAE